MSEPIITASLYVIFFTLPTFGRTSEFTYQGTLKSGTAAANGNYDFECELFDALTPGTQIESTLALSSVAVADGNLATRLDMLSVFPGDYGFGRRSNTKKVKFRNQTQTT